MSIEDQSRVVFYQCKTFYYGGASARNQEGQDTVEMGVEISYVCTYTEFLRTDEVQCIV